MLLSNIAKAAIPPKLEDAEARRHRSLLRRNIESFMSLWFFWALFIVANGGMSAAMEGKPAFYHYLSGPLGWFDPVFVIKTETTSLGKFGIFLANTFACALFFFPFSIIFRAAFRHSHVTQLAIYSPEVDLDENGEDK
jgi:hypothetical protein